MTDEQRRIQATVRRLQYAAAQPTHPYIKAALGVAFLWFAPLVVLGVLALIING